MDIITSHSTILTIPQDIVDKVVESLSASLPAPSARGSWDKALFNTLTSCSMVSQAFLMPCQKFLFSKKWIDTEKNYVNLDNFLAANPSIAAHTHELHVILHRPGDEDCSSASESSQDLVLISPNEILRRFTHVRHFSLQGSGFGPRSWGSIGAKLKASIYHVLQLPTLTSIMLSSMYRFPIRQFPSLTCATKLHLRDVRGTNLSCESDEDFEPSRLVPPSHIEQKSRLPSPGPSFLVLELMSTPTLNLMTNGFFSSVTHLELHYPSPSMNISVADFPSLRELTLFVWQGDLKGGESFFSTWLQTANEDSEIESINVSLELFYQTALVAPFENLDATLSGRKYPRLRKFSLDVVCRYISKAQVLEATGTDNLRPFLRKQLPILDSQGILSLKIIN